MVEVFYRSRRCTCRYYLIVKKYEIYKSRKCTPFVMKCSNCLSFWALPQAPLGELTTLPRLPSRKGLLAFDNASKLCAFGACNIFNSDILVGIPKLLDRGFASDALAINMPSSYRTNLSFHSRQC